MDSVSVLSDQENLFGRAPNEYPKGQNSLDDIYARKKYKENIPRVTVRDHLGRKLNTQTSYQDAITQARWRRRYRLVPEDAEDWRLPHGILPARPDYTRQAPPHTNRLNLVQKLQKSKEWLENENRMQQMLDILESEDDDFSSNIHLKALQDVGPTVAAILELRKEEERKNQQHTYVQFCASAPVTERLLPETDARQADPIFPGFCYGCRKEGMCYGCTTDNMPHTHRDKPVRTGGGFTYWKRNLPFQELKGSNPANWKVFYPPAPAFYEGQTYPDLDKYGLTIGYGQQNLSDDQYARKVLKEQLENYYKDIHRARTLDPEQSWVTREKSDVTKSGTLTSQEMHPSDQSDQHYPQGFKPTRYYMSARQLTWREGSSHSKHSKRPLWPPPGIPWYVYDFWTKPDDELRIGVAARWHHMVAEASRKNSVTSASQSVPKEEEEVSPEPRKMEEVPTKKRNLYKPPPAFKLRDKKKKTTLSSSPFSTNRKYDIKKGSGIQIKKSDKELTKFMDTPSREGTLWTEPSAFSLKDREDSRGDWHLPPTLSDQNTRPRSADSTEKQAVTVKTPTVDALVSSRGTSISSSHGGRRTPSLRTESPDSGVVSDKVDRGLPSVSTPTEVTPIPTPPRKDKKDETDLTDKNDKKVRTPTPSPPPPPIITEKPPLPPITTDDQEPVIIKREPTEKKKPVPLKTKLERETSEEKRKKTPKEPPVKKVKKVQVQEPRNVIIEAPPPLPTVHIPNEVEEELPRTPTPPPVPKRVEAPPLPALEPPAPPPLPEYMEPEQPKREVSQTFVEAPPPMPEPPPQRKPAPKIRPKRHRDERRRMMKKQSEKLDEKSTPKPFQDPRDYLAKFCIIHPDRLPHYERVFKTFLSEQQFRYADVPLGPEMLVDEPETTQKNPHMQKLIEEAKAKVQKRQQDQPSSHDAEITNNRNKITDQERKVIQDNVLVRNEALKAEIAGANEADEVVAKISYTLENLIEKYDQLQQQLDDLQLQKVRMVAQMARRLYPELAAPNYKEPGKKKKKRKTREVPEATQTTTSFSGRVTDADIVHRLTKSMIETLTEDPELKSLGREVERLEEKLKYVDDRIEEMEDEKRMVQLYAREVHLQSEVDTKQADDTDKIHLYRKLHPEVDPELNLAEVEEALQQINGHLLTKHELQYIYHILDIPGRRRINLKLFSAVAALSEKVVQLEPIIRKLINKLNINALNIKMDRVKEMFELLHREGPADVPEGMIDATSLMVELIAGGVTNTHVQIVMDRFNRDKKGIVDFLDFLIYVPLFIEIHTRIVSDPFSNVQDL